MNALVIVTRNAATIDRMLSWAERLDENSQKAEAITPVSERRAVG
jgi:hypothetical protein